MRNCAAYSSNFLPTFQDNLSVPSSRVKKTGAVGCPETSVTNYHYVPRNFPDERRSHHVSLCMFRCVLTGIYCLSTRNVKFNRRNFSSSENLVNAIIHSFVMVQVLSMLTFWRRTFFFQILAHSVFKM